MKLYIKILAGLGVCVSAGLVGCSSKAETVAAAPWQVSQAYKLSAAMKAVEIPGARIGSTEAVSGEGRLNVDCIGDRWTVTVDTPSAVIGIDHDNPNLALVKFSIDGGPETVVRVPFGKKSIRIGGNDLVHSLATAKTVAFEFTSVMGGGSPARFDLRGLPNAVTRMQPTCGSL